jgi:hypothetical protein
LSAKSKQKLIRHGQGESARRRTNPVCISYLASLETRLGGVEKEINSLKRERHEPLNRSLREDLDNSSTSETDHDSEPHGLQGDGFDDGDIAQENGAVNEPTDGMGAIVFSDEEDSAFFGLISPSCFWRHLTKPQGRRQI